MNSTNKVMPVREKSVLVKDIRKLGIRDEIASIAEELAAQVEYPIVFWVNCERDRNYTALHPQNPYQYWTTIKEGTTQQELERLVLSGIYKEIQIRRRYRVAQPKAEYRLDWQQEDQVRRFDELLGHINSFATSLECELFLEKYGIHTAEEVQVYKFEKTRDSLLEYINIQKNQPGYHWFRENEAKNLLEYASCARFKLEYAEWFKKNIGQIRPQRCAVRCFVSFCELIIMIDDIRKQYHEMSGDDAYDHILEKTIAILHLENKVQLAHYDVYRLVNGIEGKEKAIYSFIPEDMGDRDLVTFGLRSANECLGLILENRLLDGNTPVAKVVLSYDSECNAVTFGKKDETYYILLYVDLLKRIKEEIEEQNLDDDIEKRIGIERKKIHDILFRYVIFYIMLHEYAHIVNGDCDDTQMETLERREEKERKANRYADQNIEVILHFQYRQEDYQEFIKHIRQNREFLCVVKQIVNRIQLSDQLNTSEALSTNR